MGYSMVFFLLPVYKELWFKVSEIWEQAENLKSIIYHRFEFVLKCKPFRSER